MRPILLLALGLILASLSGCSEDKNHPFFKPEVGGATYATPVSLVTKLPRPCGSAILYYDPDLGETAYMTCDGSAILDNGATYAAPKFKPLAAR